MKWLRCLLALALMLIGVQLVAANSSYAVSDYDDVIQTSPSLYVYTDGGVKNHKMDISQSWLDELDQTYTARLAAGSGFPSNLMSELYDIKSSGSLGVLMREDPSWGNTVEVFGTSDPNGYCGFVGDVVNGGFGCMAHTGYSAVHVEYFTHSSFGGNGCGYWWQPQTCSDNGMNVYTAPMVVTETTQPTSLVWVPNSQASNIKYYFADFDTTYPTGYDGEVIPTQPPNATYVAMGDSYSSGEGNPPYEAGTNTGANECHRSSQAWPRKLESDNSLGLGATEFAACSGAVSDYVIDDYNQENVEPPQATYVTTDTKLVTISIGGNDIGFGDVLGACTLAADVQPSTSTVERHGIEHDKCLDALEDADTAAKSTALQNKLEAVFSGIRSLGGSNLQVVVVGYPNILPSYSNIVGSCVWGNGEPTTSGRTVASDETQSARLVHDDLNNTIQAAVDATSDSNVHFIDPTTAFAGHELCRSDPWLNNVTIDVNNSDLASGSYHPNTSGQAAYATAVGAEVQTLFP